MATVELKGLKKSFGSIEVINGIDFTVPDGSFTVMVGPSGCGKSTILRMIAGLEDTTDGQVLIDDNDVTNLDPVDRGIAMVFQSYALYPHMTVAENIGFSLRISKTPKDEKIRRVKEAAAILQLEDLLDRRPKELSGGQRQRVAIGRAIVRNPKVFLFDEPLSNLDAALRTQMRVEIAELHAKLGATMIYVTHDQVEAMTMADTIVILNHGSIQQVGKPIDLYRTPANPFVAGFIGSPKMNFIDGETAKKHGAELLGIRPEHIALSKNSGEWKGQLRHIERLGSDTIAYIDLPNIGPVIVRTDGDFETKTGDAVYLTPDPQLIHLFEGNKRLS
ncbi:MAG: ATP-binding cassette domain-containing protein [Rhodospirillales bacterium]|nr:ATP-binding cassette domain-containing protein [Rhodospirillales bacterium]